MSAMCGKQGRGHKGLQVRGKWAHGRKRRARARTVARVGVALAAV
eukprot:CAMPEP_0174720890 /NCGR_PEP_ID=MMETSP1094-20130205/34788_1 /TAXON_ID=156173 /ORGANISM="Chrysochromulina brevifilum, Strain UTEX LB 985" /LENGTH=44 /DNA_ID= /DNA_START= /DNA_END= /DNA_ORIENTATION=